MTTRDKINQKPRSELSNLIVRLKRIADDLVRVIDAYEGKGALFSCQGQGIDGYAALSNFIEIAKNARELRYTAELRRAADGADKTEMINGVEASAELGRSSKLRADLEYVVAYLESAVEVERESGLLMSAECLLDDVQKFLERDNAD